MHLVCTLLRFVYALMLRGKIAARQFLSLNCLAITLTAGVVLKEEKTPLLWARDSLGGVLGDNLGERVIASQKLSRDSRETSFAVRHQDVSQRPLGVHLHGVDLGVRTPDKSVTCMRVCWFPRTPKSVPKWPAMLAENSRFSHDVRRFLQGNNTTQKTRRLHSSLGFVLLSQEYWKIHLEKDPCPSFPFFF